MQSPKALNSVVQRFATTVAVVLMVAACGEPEPPFNEDDPPVDNETEWERPPLPEVGTIATDLAATRCEKIFECCDAGQRVRYFGSDDGSAAECAARAGAQFPGLGATGALLSAIQDGRVQFFEYRAQLCKTALEALSCEDFQSDDDSIRKLPGCRDIVVGLVEEGGECRAGWECATESCRFEGLQDAGTCERLPHLEGEDCLGRQCEGMMYCDRWATVCLRLKTLGSYCERHEECNSAFCGEDESGERFCMERPGVCEEEG